MDIKLIRTNLGATCDSLTPALSQTYGYTPDSVSVPCFYPGEIDLTYANDSRLTFNGQPIAEAVAYLLTSRADDRRGQELLDTYLAPSGAASVKAAIEADRTLGGACKTLHVHHVDGYRLYTVGANTYYGARFRVVILGG